MLFNSFEFLFAFLPAMLLAFAVLRRLGSTRWVVAALLIGSLIFYGEGEWRFLVLLVGSIAANWLIGAWLLHEARATVRRRVLVSGVALNLGLLFLFKYLHFAAATLSSLAGMTLPPLQLALPIGISFYTFQQIAYLVDLWRGAAAERDPLRYGLFVSFFPQLIAGPIVHHKELTGQLAGLSRRPFLSDLAVGLTIFTIGLAKKTLLADNMALIASPVFNAAAMGEAPGLAAAWTAVMAYALQIYFDFSAYSDMALGLARMFGIVLPFNFASPYKATSIIEFWRRWHITLSRFLRDYLYIPLGGNRRGRMRQRVNLFLTMLLGGIWHGAGWTFVLWGALHGGMLAVAHLWRERRPGPGLPPSAAQALTLLAVVLAWVPFRAADLAATGRVYAGLIGLNPSAGDLAVDPVFALAALLAGWAIALLAPNTQTLLRGHTPGLPSPGYATGLEGSDESRAAMAWHPGLAPAMTLGGLLALSLLTLGQASEFIYFQF